MIGTRVGDPEELNALDRFFCKDRKTPLKVGTVKSNMGHGEAASGLMAIAKVKMILHKCHISNYLKYLFAFRCALLTILVLFHQTYISKLPEKE